MWVKVFVPTGEGLKITYCLFHVGKGVCFQCMRVFMRRLFHVGKGVCFIDTFGIRGGEFIPCV